MKYCGKPRIYDITTMEVSKKSYQPVPNDKAWKVELVRELIEVRDNKIDLVVDCFHFRRHHGQLSCINIKSFVWFAINK